MIEQIGSVEETLDCDICIVGSGVIGQALIRELDDRRLSVIVLESGGEDREPAVDDLQRSVVHGSSFAGATEGRARQLGGTSTLWGGQALPMDPSDFATRDWVSNSGWPIGYAAVSPYHARAAEYLGIDQRDFDHDVFRQFSIGVPDWLPDAAFRYHVSKWAPVPRLIDLNRGKIARSRNVRLVIHATLTDIRLSPSGGHVEQVIARSLDGRVIHVRADRFVIAAGAIETARILLAAAARGGGPIGDGQALVGRYLMDHPSGSIGLLRPVNEPEVQRLFNLFYIGGRKYSARVSLGETTQAQARLLNISCGFNFLASSNQPIDILRRGMDALRARDPRALASAGAATLGSLPAMAHWAYHRAIRHRAVYPGAEVELVVNCEQEPSFDNRVTLANEVDALGIPRSEIFWEPGAATEHTARRFAHMLRDALAESRVGNIVLAQWVEDEAATAPLKDAFHPMGTARMAESPAKGVVDSESRVFGIDNLWIAGTAIFPTGGHSNPTFTAIALALRLADRLKALAK